MSAVFQQHEVQGTDAWHEWRRTRGGASEVAALMGCSPWFPATPRQLWEVKTGRAEVAQHAAMRRGQRLESAVRVHAEAMFGVIFEPQTAEHGRIVASLDGITFDGTTILEIKVPMKGRESDTWRHVAEHDQPPAHYLWQVQQQLLCSGAKVCRFVVAHAEGDEITDVIDCDVLPDMQMHEAIKAAWAEFFEHLDADTPPPMTDRDTEVRGDDRWRKAAEEWRSAKRALDKAKADEDDARKVLQDLAGELSAEGFGVKVSRFFRAGAIDYKKALPDNIDLEQFRKRGSWQYRITEQSE